MHRFHVFSPNARQTPQAPRPKPLEYRGRRKKAADAETTSGSILSQYTLARNPASDNRDAALFYSACNIDPQGRIGVRIEPAAWAVAMHALG